VVIVGIAEKKKRIEQVLTGEGRQHFRRVVFIRKTRKLDFGKERGRKPINGE